MKYVVTVWQNVKYRGFIEADDYDKAYRMAEELIIEDGLPSPAFEWVKEDLDFDVSKIKKVGAI